MTLLTLSFLFSLMTMIFSNLFCAEKLTTIDQRTEFVSELFHEIKKNKRNDVVSLFKKKLDEIGKAQTEVENYVGKENFRDESLNTLVSTGKNLFPDNNFECSDLTIQSIQEVENLLGKVKSPLECFFKLDELIPYIDFFQSCCNYIKSTGESTDLMSVYLNSKVLYLYEARLKLEEKFYSDDFLDKFFQEKHPELLTLITYEKFSDQIDGVYTKHMETLSGWVERVKTAFEDKKGAIEQNKKQWGSFFRSLVKDVTSIQGSAEGWSVVADENFFDWFEHKISVLSEILKKVSRKEKVLSQENLSRVILDQHELVDKTKSINAALYDYVEYVYGNDAQLGYPGYPYSGDSPNRFLYKIAYNLQTEGFIEGLTDEQKQEFLEKIPQFASSFRSFLDPLIENYPGLAVTVFLYKILVITIKAKLLIDQQERAPVPKVPIKFTSIKTKERLYIPKIPITVTPIKTKEESSSRYEPHVESQQSGKKKLFFNVLRSSLTGFGSVFGLYMLHKHKILTEKNKEIFAFLAFMAFTGATSLPESNRLLNFFRNPWINIPLFAPFMLLSVLQKAKNVEKGK